jgi:hypothetical protein
MPTRSKSDEIADRFADATRGELTKDEWEWLVKAWADRSRLESENHILRMELERVRRIARPLWRTARRIHREMQSEISAAVETRRHILPERVGSWTISTSSWHQRPLRVSRTPQASGVKRRCSKTNSPKHVVVSALHVKQLRLSNCFVVILCVAHRWYP